MLMGLIGAWTSDVMVRYTVNMFDLFGATLALMGLPWMQPEWLLGFGVIMVRLIRVSCRLTHLPGERFGPRMRGIIALWLAWLFQLASPLEVVDVGMSWAVYELTASACIGVVLGYTVRLSLDALHFAGEILGINIGLGLAGVVDPNTGTRENPVSRLLVMAGGSVDARPAPRDPRAACQSFLATPRRPWMYGPRAGAV